MMTAWSGLLVLLWVTYSYQRETGYLSERSNTIVKNALDSAYTKKAVVRNSILTCFKNFTNLLFDESYVVAHFPSFEIDTLRVICQQTENCSTLHLISGVDITDGCYFFSQGAPAHLAPMYSGNITCDANQTGCIKSEHSFRFTHRIYILPNASQNYPYNEEKGSAGCQKYCQTYSGNNGIRHEDIDWKLTHQDLRVNFTNGKVPCTFFTSYSAWKYTCLIFAKGAISTSVSKIAGPISRCERRRLKKLDNALRNPAFRDFKGFFYSKNSSVGYAEYIDHPVECKNKCIDKQGCHYFIYAHGLPGYSGCYMFNKNARQEAISVKSGSWNCSSPTCRLDYYSYGSYYEIALLPQYEFNGSGIESCQIFCKNHHGYKNGFHEDEVDWSLTGAAANHMSNQGESLECHYYTYIDRPWLGKKQCILFAKKTKSQLVWFREATVS